MKKKHITIIGAGLGGLASACLMANKYKVTVLEMNGFVGGKMNEIRNNGFRFDTGPSMLYMPEVLEEVFNLCGSKLKDFINIIPLEILCRYHYPDGTQLDSFSNKDKALQAIRSVAPEDEHNYVNFLNYASNIYSKTATPFLYNPLQSLSDYSGLKITDVLHIDAIKTISERVDKSFKSDYLRLLFKRFATYTGSSPYHAPATMNVISHIELNRGGYFVEGGMFRIAEALYKLALSLGVEFRFNSKVKEITTKEGSSTGVKTMSEFIPSDIIIANSDVTETYLNLLGKGSIKQSRINKITKLEPSCSGFVMLIGSSESYINLAHHNIFFSNNYRKEFEEIFSERIMPTNPTIYVANSSKTISSDAAEGGSNLFVLVNAPYLTTDYNWQRSREDVENFILNELEKRGLNGLVNSIRFKKSISPHDFYKQHLSHRGSIYGASSNSRLSAFLRPRNKSRLINNLYFTGGSTHPGGGIPLVMLSALHVSKLIQRDYMQ